MSRQSTRRISFIEATQKIISVIKGNCDEKLNNPTLKEMAKFVYNNKVLSGEFQHELKKNNVVTSFGVIEHLAKFVQERNITGENNHKVSDNSQDHRKSVTKHIFMPKQDNSMPSKVRAFSWTSGLASKEASPELRASFSAWNDANLNKFSSNPEIMEANEAGKELTISQNKISGFIDTYKELKKSFRRLSEHDIDITKGKNNVHSS